MAQRRSRRATRLRAAAAVATLLCTPSTSASLLDSLRARALLPRAAAVVPNVKSSVTYSNASSAQPTVVNATNQGRYGHSAVYLPPPTNELLLIGGQVGENGTGITNEVLRFRVASSFLWGDRPVSAIPDNPAQDISLASGLPATAWGAATVDSHSRVWLVGGITADCETDGIAHVLAGTTSSWTVPSLSPHYPPRRRQASAVAVSNATTGGTDVWVLGGIADEFTCSGETIGYAGLDRYDTVSGLVESMPWNVPGGVAPSSWEPPVSDYSATSLASYAGVVVIGGQASDGHLADTTSVLVFDVASRGWTREAVSNIAPAPRMGHTAVLLSSGSILIHGGLSSAHAVLSDLFLLSSSVTGWVWTKLAISDHSMASPALAYHSATQIVGGTIVVAFGIDGATSAPSSAFWFLTVDEAAGTYTWKDTFDGNNDAVTATVSYNTTMTPVAKFVKKAVQVIANPKMSTSSSAPVQQATAASSGYQVGADSGTQASVPAWSSAVSPPPPSSSPRTTPASTAAAVKLPSSSSRTTVAVKSPSTSASNAQEGASTTSKSTIIGASIGAIGAAVAAAGVLFLFLRRRAAEGAHSTPSTPVMGSAGDGSAPFVSQIMYTRPAPMRRMSLGSTLSALSPRTDTLPPSAASPNVAGLGAGGGLGTSQDPFSDSHRVNEVGQLERAGSAASATSTSGVVGSLTGLVLPARGTPQDTYTAPAPTLAAKRSLRRPALPVPGTPAELIGVAITSDDGHDGLPYLAAAGPSESAQPWDPAAQRAFQMPTAPASVQEIREVHPAAPAGGDVPAVLRPGTPLRVANPDPFSDP